MKERDIFDAALAIAEPDKRDAFLAAACGDDADLKDHLRGLLAAERGLGSFLEAPAPTPTLTITPPPIAEQPGTVIGPYKLMEQIGEGGMGVVYVAEQTKPVRRKVALKIIKPGMDTKQVIARFEAERQALAMMDHPNIAKVHDAGATESGRPYFVMELVRGIPITDYCDREHLSIPERLELFVLVCRAVQHAHQKGVIHRDLKPSNILVTVVDGAAVPKVIDFGVAKATGGQLTERTVYTAFQQFVGTPLYMSPEQADLSGMDVDTRSDIYSLGVLLYELLTGTTPFDQDTFKKAAFDELRRIIREQEPPKPSTRLSSLGATRATVSANRKADTRQLDRAVRGELDWIVMKALEKDRRHRYETANDFAADVMRYLTDRPVEACPPSAWYRFSKYARRHRAMLTTAGLIGVILTLSLVGLSIGLHQIARERNRAVLLQRQAEERARWLLLEVTDMEKEINEARERGNVRFEPWQRQFIERVLTVLEKYVREFGLDREARYESALACLRLGRIQHVLGRPEVAEAHFRRALPVWEALAREFPDNPDCLLCLAGCLMNIGHIQRYPDREPYYRRALLLNEQLVDRFPGYFKGHGQLAGCLVSYGRCFEVSGRPDQAVSYYRRALLSLLRCAAGPAENPQQPIAGRNLLSWTCRCLEKVLTATGRLAEVDRDYADALTLLEGLGPISAAMRAVLQNQWAFSLATRPDVPSRDLRRAGELARRAAELTSLFDARDWLMLGVVLELTGDPQGSDAAFRRGVELGGARSDNTLNDIAWRLVSEPPLQTVRPSIAVQMAEQAVKLNPVGAHVWNTLGVAYYRAGNWAGAIEALEKAEALAPDKSTAFNAFFLAMAHWRKGDKREARSWFNKAVAWMDKNQPKDAELIRFRAEAEALLGVAELPAGVFARP
jgi:serine/threonine protein kinase/tetratricopeptide (TPR) repeat protein